MTGIDKELLSIVCQHLFMYTCRQKLNWTRDDVGARPQPTYSNLCEAKFRGQVQVCVALLFVVWIAQVIRVVAKNALH